MEQARAVVVDPQAVGRLAIKPMPVRAPLPFEALVRVKAISLNLGEVRRALTMLSRAAARRDRRRAARQPDLVRRP